MRCRACRPYSAARAPGGLPCGSSGELLGLVARADLADHVGLGGVAHRAVTSTRPGRRPPSLLEPGLGSARAESPGPALSYRCCQRTLETCGGRADASRSRRDEPPNSVAVFSVPHAQELQVGGQASPHLVAVLSMPANPPQHTSPLLRLDALGAEEALPAWRRTTTRRPRSSRRPTRRRRTSTAGGGTRSWARRCRPWRTTGGRPSSRRRRRRRRRSASSSRTTCCCRGRRTRTSTSCSARSRGCASCAARRSSRRASWATTTSSSRARATSGSSARAARASG